MGNGNGDQDWRLELMLKAQARFERDFIEPTLADIATMRTQLERQMAGLSAPDAEMRKAMLEADMQRLNGIEHKIQVVLSAGRRNFRNQAAGSGGFNAEKLLPVSSKRKK